MSTKGQERGDPPVRAEQQHFEPGRRHVAARPGHHLPAEPPGALREWRTRRRVSQLELAARAGTTQRHVSFSESGRSAPGRAMVIRLAESLEVPLRAESVRNPDDRLRELASELAGRIRPRPRDPGPHHLGFAVPRRLRAAAVPSLSAAAATPPHPGTGWGQESSRVRQFRLS